VIRDQRLDLVKRLSMMRITARRTKRPYKKTAFTEGLQKHPNQKIRARNEFLPVAAQNPLKFRLAEDMASQRSKPSVLT
jgi:uncharacterized protein (DUF2344 family)